MTSFNDDQLAAFVAAAIGVSKVSRKYRDIMADVDDENEMALLEVEEESALVATVKAQGLTIRDYNGIVRASREDAALRLRIEGLIGGPD